MLEKPLIILPVKKLQQSENRPNCVDPFKTLFLTIYVLWLKMVVVRGHDELVKVMIIHSPFPRHSLIGKPILVLSPSWEF